jgi:copper chaperone NosL
MTMTRLARSLTAAAAVLLLTMFVTPLWRIDLIAPQYPEGLGMLIHLDTVTGIQPNDLENINALNHYIGMKRIDPAAIPVLRVMPWVVGALAAGAFLVALVGRRAALVGWLVAFGVAGALGMYEFWWWQYDYGHDLAADAIIKVPGMSYQPPLIGAKQLLNFTAISWPSLGSVAAALAFGCGALALWLSMRRRLLAAVPRSPAARRVAAAGAAAA